MSKLPNNCKVKNIIYFFFILFKGLIHINKVLKLINTNLVKKKIVILIIINNDFKRKRRIYNPEKIVYQV